MLGLIISSARTPILNRSWGVSENAAPHWYVGRKMRKIASDVLLLALCGLAVGPAYAQAPERITARFDDWTVSCANPLPPAAKTCEMVQSQTMKGQSNPVGQITISRPAKNQPFKFFFQVPANAWFQTGIKFVAQPDQPALVADFRWCLPSRCLADVELSETAVSKFGSYTAPGSEQYKDAAQHDVSLPVSFKGFAPALEWMGKQ
jgi:invasion protein IalB